MVRRRILSLVAIFSTLSQAQTPEPVVNAAVGDSNMKIEYGSVTWNLDSTKSDSAFLFLRDKASGKVVKIQLEETEPDSSVFSGSFAVTMGKGAIDPEIFIPPKDMRNNADAVKKFSELLSKGTITAKPIVVNKAAVGGRTVDVYDTKEQAARAAKVIADQKEAKASLAKPILKEQDMEVLKNAKKQAELKAQADEAAKRETERLRMEQIERQKAEAALKAQREATDAERAKRKAEADALANQAYADFQKGDFKSAEEKYRRSTELDPENKGYYYWYGVCLYRNEKLNEALVILRMAQDDSANLSEKKYYMGLILMRLKEYPQAITYMREAQKDPKSPITASATFYEGVILFTQEDYKNARAPFERVIDISQDPRLDEQAEQYLDSIIGLQKEKEAMSKRLFLNGMVGVVYDSNVLLSSDSEVTQGAATKVGDLRYLASGDAEYRPIYNKVHELGVKANAFYMYSAKDKASFADPFLINASLPYTYKGMAFGKGYKMAAKVAYETIFLDANQDYDRENILQSQLLNVDNTFVMHKRHIATYTAEVRRDISKTGGTGTKDADALKMSAKTAQTFILDNASKEILVANLGLVVNDAKGDDIYYKRYEIGVNYMRPAKWDSTLILGLSYYRQDYSKQEITSTQLVQREDNNTTVSVGLLKPVKDWVSWLTMATYSKNGSNQSSFDYSKYSVLTTAVFNYSL